MKLKKQDILLLAALLAGVLLLGAFLMLTRKSGAEVVVKVAGKQVTSIPLDKDTKYTIHGVNGGTNELVIADGQIWLEQASCPDKLAKWIYARFYLGMTVKEIAQAEGVDLSWVYKSIKRGLIHLAKSLSERNS